MFWVGRVHIQLSSLGSVPAARADAADAGTSLVCFLGSCAGHWDSAPVHSIRTPEPREGRFSPTPQLQPGPMAQADSFQKGTYGNPDSPYHPLEGSEE